MGILDKVTSDYRLYLTIIGSLSYLAIYFIDYVNDTKTNRVPLTCLNIFILLVSFTVIGCFTYIAFYEDIQKGQNKTILLLGFSSYYFATKLRSKFSKTDK